MSKKPETLFKDRVRADLAKLPNCWFTKIQQLTKRGDPDFILCLNTCFVGLELKKDKKEKPTKLQAYVLKAIGEAGGVGLVAYPENWDDTYDFLYILAENGYEYMQERMEEKKAWVSKLLLVK